MDSKQALIFEALHRRGRGRCDSHGREDDRSGMPFGARGFADRAFGAAFGRGGFGGGRWGGRGRRGDSKYLVLETLASGPRHGYEIIGLIEEKRGFRPSPGSIYPTLQMLEDGGFVEGRDTEGKRVYTITESGRTMLAERGETPEDENLEDDPRHAVKSAAMKLGAAVMSARDSDAATLAKIGAILDRARKEIYAILASA